MYARNTVPIRSATTDSNADSTNIIEFIVNGKNVTVDASLYPTLLQAIREKLKLAGTKYGCGEGACGACTVLLDGKPVRSCTMPTISMMNKEVITIEGLSENGELHPVQQAFIDLDAMQCGYCTSGMILTAVGLLNDNPNPGKEEIIQAMNGNLCRCCNYTRIVSAVQHAAQLHAKK